MIEESYCYQYGKLTIPDIFSFDMGKINRSVAD